MNRIRMILQAIKLRQMSQLEIKKKTLKKIINSNLKYLKHQALINLKSRLKIIAITILH